MNNQNVESVTRAALQDHGRYALWMGTAAHSEFRNGKWGDGCAVQCVLKVHLVSPLLDRFYCSDRYIYYMRRLERDQVICPDSSAPVKICQSRRRAIIRADALHTIAMTAKHILPRQTKTPEADDARLRQGEKTREIILEAAAKLLLKSSASGMAMSELVKATGVPASSIYWHFGSKDGVVSAVVETGVQRWLQQFPDPSAWQATGDEGVRAVMEVFISSLKKDFLFVKLLLKVGLEFSEQENDCVRIVRDARAKVISYGVSVLSPFFSSMSAVQAKAAALRVVRKLMALADGISISLSLEKSPVIADGMLDGLAEIALSLIRQETLAAKASRR